MKNFLIVGIVTALAASNAMAAPQTPTGSQIHTFLEKLVDDYTGSGLLRTNFGTVSTSTYSTDLHITQENDTFKFVRDSVTDNLHSLSTSQIAISGDVLYFSTDFVPNTPVAVTAANDTFLEFHFTQVDAYGRPIAINYVITLTGKNLEIHRTSTINDVVVSDDDLIANGF